MEEVQQVPEQVTLRPINKGVCIKCLRGRPHPWHDNGEYAGDLPEEAGPPTHLPDTN